MSSRTPLAPTLGPQKLAAIDRFLEDFYDKSRQAAGQLQRVDMGKTQIRGLETIVTSATRFSQVVNYVKNQAGKDTKKKWSVAAPFLLEQMEELEKKAAELGENDPATVLDIKMRLARGWAGQVVAHALYARMLKERGDG